MFNFQLSFKKSKIYQQCLEKNKKQENNGPQNTNTSKTDKRYQFCQEMISKLYEAGIQKFPTNIPIRIYYAVFLMKVIKSKQHALNEILDAENFKCSLDERFTLYYIKRSIEKEISEMSKQEGDDYGEQRTLEGKINHFRAAMEQTVTLLMEFWSQFSDDKPDLTKLYDIGSKLFPLKLLVDDIWKRISRGKSEQIPKVFRIYSKYLIDIFNDKQAGVELLEKASKMEQNFNSKKQFHFNYSSDVNIDGQEDGIIFMTTEEEKLGQIMGCNLTAASLFGYQKAELINRNVNILQPYLYSKNHDDILKHYLENENKTYTPKDRLLYGKSKSQYIFSIIINIKPVYHALKDGNEFFGVFKKEKMIKYLGIVHVNEKGIIKDISASCINILGIDIKTISLEQISINKLFEDLDEFKTEYMSKQGRITEYIFPKISEDTVLFRKSEKTSKVNVQMQDLNLKYKGDELIGRIFKIEQIQDKIPQKNMRSKIGNTSGIKKAQQQPVSGEENLFSTPQIQQSFQFKLCIQDDSDILYNGEFISGQYSEIIANTSYYINEQSDIINDSKVADFNLNSNRNNVIILKSKIINNEFILENNKSEKEIVLEKNYAEGIRTLRLVNNELHDADKFKFDDSEEEEDEKKIEEEQQQKGQKYKHQKQGPVEENNPDQQAGVNSAKGLNEELDKQSESTAIRSLKIFSMFIIFVMIGIASIDFALKNIAINYQQNTILEIRLSSNRIAAINEIICYIREYALVNLQVRIPQINDTTMNQNAKIEKDAVNLQTSLRSTINELEQLNNQIEKITTAENKLVDVNFKEQTNQSEFNVNSVSEQIISRSHNIAQISFNDIRIDQTDSYFVQFNGLNDYIFKLFDNYNTMNDNIVSNIDNIGNNSLTFLIISIVIMIFFSFILLILLGKTIFAKQLILSVFLDIPEKTAKYLYQKCENFLAQLGSNDEDDIHSEVDFFIDDREEGQESRSSIFGKKRKKFKNTDRGSIGFLLRIAFVVIFVETYFIVNYFLGENQIYVLKQTIKEFNYTTIAEAYYSLTLNAQRQMFIDDKFTILNQNSKVIMTEMINYLYKIDSTMHEEHARNTEYHTNSADYLGSFENIMFKDACEIIVNRKGASQTECDNFANGIVKQVKKKLIFFFYKNKQYQGMITVIIRYFQLIRYFKDRYDYVLNNPNKNFDFAQFGNQVSIQTKYIKSAFRYLQEVFDDEMTKYFDSFKVQRILLLILFIILLLLASFLCWTPFLAQLNKEIWSTKCLLSFIPVDEMTKIKSIGNFIREFIIDRKI
ncbi:PAS domain S-box family protein [Ichthyophthirius multifiliis]|uniref:PAS domain S-box family protein n=1 Tax=Ichthyophthirius multifiliis TaxID=5932 RepID=G0R4M1_ICHMU|nr:PAS domain S-box family protein [Ichthyophthirius multifiliis]EGR27581.1 PAS domain S-box family protein [Ichthyophthirius multifiliis]|eukprot:XP_004025033.1 PAS domain S-box family protein [Ichthyophthirius multifiliis]